MCDKNQKFGHNYTAGICLVCGRSQRPVHKVAPMPNLFKDLCNRKKISPNSGHQLVGDIIEEFGADKKMFPFLMMIYKKVGDQQMRVWFSEIKTANPKYSKIALIISNYKKWLAGIKWI